MSTRNTTKRAPTGRTARDKRARPKDLEVAPKKAATVKAGRSPDPEEGGE